MARPLDDALGGTACWLPARPGGSLLDIGCGSGAFLARMRSLGWSVTGVEPDPAAADLARRTRGLEVAKELSELPGRRFDAITMHHVIEHLSDPRTVVADLTERLTPGGRLVVVTPNIRSLGRRLFQSHWVHWDPPRHLWIFSTRALATLMRATGLKIERQFTTARYARFVWTAGTRIRASGRVDQHDSSEVLKLAAMGFQVAEHIAGLVASEVGEELVVIAKRD